MKNIFKEIKTAFKSNPKEFLIEVAAAIGIMFILYWMVVFVSIIENP